MSSMVPVPESGKKTRERRIPKINPRVILMARTCKRIVVCSFHSEGPGNRKANLSDYGYFLQA
jgi:hypothetical protein